MFKVTGVESVKYTNKSGKLVEGYNVYLSYEKTGVSGMVTDRQWLSKNFVARCGYAPEVGQMVELKFSRSRTGQGFSLDRIDVVK